jgi:hypothetical protein
MAFQAAEVFIRSRQFFLAKYHASNIVSFAGTQGTVCAWAFLQPEGPRKHSPGFSLGSSKKRVSPVGARENELR